MADFVAKIMADLDDSKFSSQIKELQNKYKGSKIDIQLNIVGGDSKNLQDLGKRAGKKITEGMDDASKSTKAVSSQLSNLLSLTKQINASEISLGKLDASKNSEQIKTLKRQITELRSDANDLFKELSGKLSSDQEAKVGITLQQLGNRLDETKAKIKDAKFNEYIDSLKKINGLELTLAGLDPEKNADKIKQLTKELDDARTASAVLKEEVEKLSVDGKFTAEQEKRLANEKALLEVAKNRAAADASDAARESARQTAETNRIKQLNAQFEELLKTKKEIAAIDVKLAKLNPDTDSTKIAGLLEDRSKLDSKAYGIQTAIGSDMSVDWQKKLDEVEQNANSAISEIRNGQVDKQALAEEAKNAKGLQETYKKLIDAKKEMAAIEQEVESLDSTDDSRVLERKIARYEELSNQVSTYYETLKAGMSAEELASVDSAIAKLDDDSKRKLEDSRAAKADDTDATAKYEAEKQALKDRNAAVEEFLRLQSQIGSKKVEIAKLDPSKDIELINQLEAELADLEKKSTDKLASIDSGLNTAERSKWLDILRQSGNQLDEIKAKAKDVARQNDINKNYDELLSTLKTINGLKIKIAGLDPEKDASKIAEYEREIEELTDVYQLFEEETKGKLNLDQMAELANEAQSTEIALRRIASAKEDAQKKLADKTDAKEVADTYQKLKTTIQEMSKVEISMVGLDENSDDAKRLATRYEELKEKAMSLRKELGININSHQLEELNEIAAKTKQKIEDLKIAAQEAKQQLADSIDIKLNNGTFESQVATLSARLRSLGIASDATEAEIEELRAAIKDMARTDIEVDEKIAAFNRYQETLQKCTNNIKTMQQDQKGYKKSFSSIVSSLVQFASTYIGVQEVFNALQKGVQTVVELDYALIDLKKTTTMTRAELNSFYYEANDVAKEMGVTTQQIIEQASAWSRLGYSSKEAATEMAKLSSMFATISPGMTVDEATSGLVTVMKAYGLTVDEVLDGIMSKVNSIGNNFALDNQDITGALQVSAASMAVANNSLEETVALITSGTEITQDATNVGQALKTISMRIRGYDEETEQLSDTYANLTGEIADLTKVASNDFKGISLFTDESKTEYKSTYEILREVSEIWDELTDKDRANLLETLFGKQRSNVGAAILSNFSSATEAMDVMANSAGSAEAEMAIATDSIQFKLNALAETWTGVAQNVFQRDDIKAVVDLLITLSEAIGGVVEQLGLVGTIGVGSGIFAFFKNLG